MYIDRIIALISSIATLAATVIVLFTLLEMRNQRKNAMSPDLAFSRKMFYIYYDPESKYKTQYIWADKEIRDDSIDRNYINFHVPYPIEVANIGMGSAKNIEIKWDFDDMGLIEKVKQLDKKKLFEVKNQLQSEYEYILPTHIKSESYLIHIPSIFTRLTALILFLLAENHFEDKITKFLEDFPKIKMHVSYCDAGGTKYKKDYKMYFDVYTQRQKFYSQSYQE